jgi:hypothetical protein
MDTDTEGIDMNLASRFVGPLFVFGGAIPVLIVAIGIFSVAFLANESPPSQAHFGDVVWSALIAIAVSLGAVATWFVARAISVRLSRFVLPLYISFTFYGQIQGIADDLLAFDFVRDRLLFSDKIFLPILILVTVFIYLGLSRFISWNSTVTRYAAGLLLLLSLWNIAGWTLGQTQSQEFEAVRATNGIVLEKPAELFPIYWFLFDGYARDDVLADLYDFDNSPFLNELEDLGFNINHEANANFSNTVLVIPSLMEMENLGAIDSKSALSIYNDRSPAHWRFEESAFASLLEGIGYEGLELSSYRSSSLMTRVFPVAYYESTGFTALPPRFQPWRGSALTGFVENMEDTAAQVGARNSLVFSYNFPPHPPYLFNSTGVAPGASPLQPIEKTRREDWKDVNGYIGQLEYVNSQLLPTVTRIIEESPVDPLIIIVSDHGTASNWNDGRFSSTPNEALFYERIGILSAIHAPAQCDSNVFDESDALMNMFSLVLNSCFGADIPLHPNDVYWGNIGAFDHYVDGVWSADVGVE